MRIKSLNRSFENKNFKPINMNKEIITNDKLVHLAVLETKIHTIHNEEERNTICRKMCEIAKDDGVSIINESNGNLCGACNLYDPSNTNTRLQY